jgi:hypothetical protein
VAEWLDKVRGGKLTASQADIDTAMAEAKDLWDALTHPDYTGKVTEAIKAARASGDTTMKDSLEKGLRSWTVSDLTGAEFTREHSWRGTMTKAPEVAPDLKLRGVAALNVLGFAGNVYTEGWQDATLDVMDVTGMGRQWLEQQRRNELLGG